MSAPPRRRVVRRVLASALGLLVALAAAEALLRATGAAAWRPRDGRYNFRAAPGSNVWIFDPARPPDHVWDRDPYGRLPPGARMTYEIDATGVRGVAPPAGRRSVLVLGDSFTFGEGVPLADTFVARLERTFAERAERPAATPAPGALAATPAPAFINAGVPGYGTIEEATRLPVLLESFRPAAVLVVFVPNDPIPLPDTFPTGGLILRKSLEPPPVRLLALLGDVLGRAARDRAVEEWYLSYYTGARSARWGAARRALAEMQAACAARGARFGVAHFPLLYRLDERPLAAVEEAVAAACAELRAPYVDLTPALATVRDRDLWVHPTDQHPSARAHEIAAAALAPLVEDLLR